MDNSAMMEKSRGEVMEIAAKLLALAKDAEEKEADPDSMETDGGAPKAAAAEGSVEGRGGRCSVPSQGPAPAIPVAPVTEQDRASTSRCSLCSPSL